MSLIIDGSGEGVGPSTFIGSTCGSSFMMIIEEGGMQLSEGGNSASVEN